MPARALEVWGELAARHAAGGEPPDRIGYTTAINAAGLALQLDGVPCIEPGTATVEKARLFGKKVSCEAQAISPNTGTNARQQEPPTAKPKSRLDGLKFVNFD